MFRVRTFECAQKRAKKAFRQSCLNFENRCSTFALPRTLRGNLSSYIPYQTVYWRNSATYQYQEHVIFNTRNNNSEMTVH